MSLFDHFLLHQQSQSQPGKPALTLPFLRLPEIKTQRIVNIIKGLEPISGEVQVTDESTENQIFITVQFEKHQISILGFPTPIPQSVYDKNVQQSLWNQDFKQYVSENKAHVLLTYLGSDSDTNEQYLALYKVARALLDEQLLGVINEAAWTAHPIRFLQEVIHPKMINVCRESPPLMFWTGLIMVAEEQATWFISKGFHVYKQPDLAIYAEDAHPHEIQQLFFDIYDYAFREKLTLKEGMVMAFDEQTAWELVEPPNEAYFNSPSGVLALIPATDLDSL